MIFVVEVPPDAEPHAWFAFDDDDLLRKVAVSLKQEPWDIWDSRSARELLELFDETPEAAGVAERYPGICVLGQEFGWDAPLYRADALAAEAEQGLYSPEPVTPLQACLAALKAAPGDMRLYRDEDTALHAVDAADPLYDRPGGWRARWALRQQLIAVEALADDH